ncbi:MAG: SCO family protein [Alphaproteobacteria bacterium]
MTWPVARGGLALGLALGLVLPFCGGTAAAKPSNEAVLEKSESAIGKTLPDLSFTDSAGQRVSLAELRGRPLIISMVYTGCADICPVIIENLYPAVQLAQSTLGKDSFSVITVGFDVANDTPERMRSYARTRGVDLPNWRFLSADAGTVAALSDAIGFEIIPSAGGFGHAAQVTISDAQGRIYRHIYGGSFAPQMVVNPLLEIVYGRTNPVASVAGLIDRVKLFCTVYNPNTQRYYFNYSLFIEIAIGVASLMFMLIWLAREFRRRSAEARNTPQ